jgi:predicted transposase YdaD
MLTKNKMNNVLNPKPTQLIRLLEVSDGEQRGLGLQTNYFPLNVLHLFVIKPDEAVQLVRNCVQSYSEGHTLLWKVNAMHKTILPFKHYT